MKQNILLCCFVRGNLGVRQISSYLKSHGINTAILVLDKDDFLSTIDYAYVSSFDVVGISFVTDDFIKASLLSRGIRDKCRKERPVIIFGGCHATIRSESCLRRDCDYVVRGEGEEAMLEISSNISSIATFQNVAYRSKEEFIANPLRDLEHNLDKYPFPDFDDCKDLQEYCIMTTRGCPFSCSYCYNNYRKRLYNNNGEYYRSHSIDYIITQLEWAQSKYKGLKYIRYLDDSFMARSLEDLDLLRRKYSKKIKLPYSCLANPHYITEEKLKILTSAGLKSIYIGIQTGSETVNRQAYNRVTTNESVLECVRLCNKYLENFDLSFIFNSPYETEIDIKKTIDLILRFPKGPWTIKGFDLAYYPGTEITERALKDGYISFLTEEEEMKGYTIQGPSNNPFAGLDNTSNNPLWKINIDFKKKQRLNNIFPLIEHFPKPYIRFLMVCPFNISSFFLKCKSLISLFKKRLVFFNFYLAMYTKNVINLKLTSLNESIMRHLKNITTVVKSLIKSGTLDFGFVQFVEIETITACNRRCSHCPNSKYERGLIENTRKMEEKVFYKIIDELAELDYRGWLSPHFYGEPLLDARLPDFMRYARRKLKNVYIAFFTNGDLMTVELYNELVAAGVNHFQIIRYGHEVDKNILKIFNFRERHGDNGVTIYHGKLKIFFNRGGILSIKGACKMRSCVKPSQYITFDHNGNVLLCCNDYFGSVKFGNVTNEKLIEIWKNTFYKRIRNKTKKGLFESKICTHCRELVIE